MIRPGVRLDRNELHIGPAPACPEALRVTTAADLHSYAVPEPDGAYSALTRRLAVELGVDERRLGVGHDGEEGLLGQTFDLAALNSALTGTPTLALLPDVSWPHYDVLRREAGLRAGIYSIVEQGDRWVFDVDELLALAPLAPALLLIPWIDNPTGAQFPAGRLPEVLAAFPRSLVVVDEAYCGFRADEPSAATLVADHPHLAVLRTFAKAHGLAGTRLAYGVYGDRFAHVWARTRRYLGPSQVEAVALAALDAVDHLAHVRRFVTDEQERRRGLLGGWPGVTVYDCPANFTLVRFAPHMTDRVRQRLDAAGIAMRWLDGPKLDDPKRGRCVRMSVGDSGENTLLRHTLAAAVPIATPPRFRGRADLLTAYLYAGPAAPQGAR